MLRRQAFIGIGYGALKDTPNHRSIFLISILLIMVLICNKKIKKKFAPKG